MQEKKGGKKPPGGLAPGHGAVANHDTLIGNINNPGIEYFTFRHQVLLSSAPLAHCPDKEFALFKVNLSPVRKGKREVTVLFCFVF